MTIGSLLRRALALLGVAAVAAGPVRAQGIEGQVGRFYEDGGWDMYRLGLSRPLTGPLGLGVHGSYLERAGGGEGRFAGLGLDLTAFKGGGQGPYLVAGVGAGMGSPVANEPSDVWGSWSVGAGYQLLPVSFLSFGAEARWRQLSLDSRDGFEVAAGLSIRLGGGGRGGRARSAGSSGAPPPAQPVSDLPAATPPLPPAGEGEPKRLREAVVATARDAMGRPYQWGGTGANGGGFDCSGLIQHAYGQHGIPLPRTSREQAKEGKAIARERGALRPGDVLTFSNSGGPVTHVGLYIGDGQFIHSASRGVQVSLLSGEDPYGRWWYKRWVGVRRIVED
jgi:cell wall-associated NlpC family hydrolase